MSTRYTGLRIALLGRALLTLTFVLASGWRLSLQGSAVPQAIRDPQRLAAWLGEDDEQTRIWLALANASEAPVAPEARDVLVGHILSRVSPDELESKLEADPSVVEGTLRVLGDALSSSGPPLTKRLQDYIARAAFSRSRRLSRRGAPFAEDEGEKLLTLQFVSPQRFVSERGFRERVLDMLPRAFDPDGSGELRDLLLWSINQVPGIDFASSERIEVAWRAVPRRSLQREAPYRPESWSIPNEVSSSIEASFYSLPSRFFDASTALGFLQNVRGLAPERTIVALVDLPLSEELSPRLADQNVHLVETYGRNYTPWFRDSLILARRRDGGVVIVVRADFAADRADDNFMGLELVQGLPEPLDRRWGKVRWAKSPVPFHNGQVLLTSECAWISVHTVEYRTLQLLGLTRVPLNEFQHGSGWLHYREASRKAGAELQFLLGREVCWVHPLPEEDGAIRRIGGGAGFDLDSLLTLLKGPGERLSALVADVDLGGELLAAVPGEELEGFRTGFELMPAADSSRERLLEAQRTPAARDLDDFLELIRETLESRGMIVRRLPILLVPVALLSDRADFHHDTFLITWNNVVLEERGGVRRAEGFGSLLPSVDAGVTSTFRALGYRLDLIPPLVRSVVLNGGYRCASQHLRYAPMNE